MAILKDLTVFGVTRLISDTFCSDIYANKHITNGGTSSQFVKGDGTLDSNVYVVASTLGNYLPLAGGTMTGTIFRNYTAVSNEPMISVASANLDVWIWRVKDYATGVSTNTSNVYGFGVKYLGTGDGNNNNLVLYSDNQAGTQVAAVTIKQDGTITLPAGINTYNGTNKILHEGNIQAILPINGNQIGIKINSYTSPYITVPYSTNSLNTNYIKVDNKTNGTYNLLFSNGASSGNNDYKASYINSLLYYNCTNSTLIAPNFEYSGQITSTINNGTAPFIVNSSTMVDNLYVEYAQKLHPIISKDYEDNTFYATSSGNHDLATRIFLKLKPDGTNDYWHVMYKIKIWIPASNAYITTSYVEYFGHGITLGGYKIWNTVKSGHAPYYHAAFWLKSDGLNAGYSHLIGINIIYATNYTSSNWYRYMHVDLLEYEGCTIELLNTAVKYSTITEYNTTNYNGISNYNATSQGLQETGDTTDITTMRLTYSRIITGTNGLKMYSLIMQDGNGTWQSFTTTSGNGTSKTKNTVGFKLGSRIYYLNSSTDIAANTLIGNSIITAYQSLIDLRYSINITANSLGNGLTYAKPLYIVGTIGYDGLFYLSDKWWTQDEPSTEDGKIYIRVVEGVYNDYNTTSMPSGNYRGDLVSDGYAFWFKNGKFRRYYHITNINISEQNTNSHYVTFVSNISGNQNIYTNGNLLYNASNGTLSTIYVDAQINPSLQWGTI